MQSIEIMLPLRMDWALGERVAKTQGGRKYEVFSHGIADGRGAVGGR